MNTKYLLLFFLNLPILLSAQTTFTRQDTLRGTITPERSWWDLTYYHLQVEVNPKDSTLEGVNTLQFMVLEKGNRMQIDLQPPMKITKVLFQDQEMKVTRDENAHFVDLPNDLALKSIHELDIYFQGSVKCKKVMLSRSAKKSY